MLRVASTAAARRIISQGGSSSRRFPHAAIQNVSFHGSVRREEESKPAPVEPKGGLFGTGLSEWFALPIGIAAAVPILKLEWYVVNEETQLAAVLIAFCVALYSQGGKAIGDALDERAKTLLKEHSEVEDKVISALEEKLAALESSTDTVDNLKVINSMREKAYEDLNAAGAIKPQHDFKAQIERILGLIAQEELSVVEKKKSQLMEEATAAVTEQFSSQDALKKAALTSAIATIKGGAGSGDPVKEAFVQFFKDKATAAKKSTDDSEEKAQRASMIAKINGVAKNEGFFFEIGDNGMPKMVA